MVKLTVSGFARGKFCPIGAGNVSFLD